MQLKSNTTNFPLIASSLNALVAQWNPPWEKVSIGTFAHNS